MPMGLFGLLVLVRIVLGRSEFLTFFVVDGFGYGRGMMRG